MINLKKVLRKNFAIKSFCLLISLGVLFLAFSERGGADLGTQVCGGTPPQVDLCPGLTCNQLKACDVAGDSCSSHPDAVCTYDFLKTPRGYRWVLPQRISGGEGCFGIDDDGIDEPCKDRYDNDCDGFIDCADDDCNNADHAFQCPSGSQLKFKDGTRNEYLAVIGSNGAMRISGTLSEHSSFSPNGNNFVIEDASGYAFAIIEKSTGNVYLRGKFCDRYTDTYGIGYCTIGETTSALNSALTNGDSDFVITNSTGQAIAYFNNVGDLYIRGYLAQNQII